MAGAKKGSAPGAKKAGRIGKSISLPKARIELSVGGKPTQVLVAPKMRLSPVPKLVFEFNGSLPALPRFDQLETTIRLLPQGARIAVTPASLSIRSAKSVSFSLVPRREPVTILSTAKRLKSLQFSLLNFPHFYGKHDTTITESPGKMYRRGEVRLVAGDWRVHIYAVPDLKAISEELQRSGGFAVTHMGSVHKEGGTFTVKEAQHLIEGLRLFLSFARGAFCSLALESGFDKAGEKVWERWGSHMVAPWGFAKSWFDTMHGEILAETLPGFWDRFNDPDWKDTVNAALYWYLRSNDTRSVGVDGGLILTQAALERICYVQQGCPSSKPIFSTLLRDTMISMRLKTNVPRGCANIRALAKANNWNDAPHALAMIRNQLIHPKQNYGKALSRSYYEAWNLGQRYVELMLLRLFGHKGVHGNRLTQQWRGEVARVPWR